MAKQEATVEELVRKIERGELLLPEMQRRYVWRAPRVRDLLDSLYRGWPSGAILLWDQQDAEIPLREFAVEQEARPAGSSMLLLDGQQRLTSLAAVIRGKPLNVRGRKRPIEILFNLEHPDTLEFVTEVDEDGAEDEDAPPENAADASEDELQRRFDRMAFVVGTKKLARLPHWVKVSEVFQTEDLTPFMQRAGVEGFSDPRFERYRERLSRLRSIRHYTYRMDVLPRDLSYQEVTEIFVRVNSLGAKLRSSDLALAQITAKWRGALETFREFQKSCAREGFEFDLGIHLRSLVVFATGQSRFRTAGSIELPVLRSAWEQSKEAFGYALSFLRENVGVDSPALLSSPFLVITVASWAHQRGFRPPEGEDETMRRWVLLANAKGRYSRGSSETILDQDLAILRRGGGPRELLDALQLQVGRLDVSLAELKGKTQRSGLFKTMFLAFREEGARDWQSRLKISRGHSGVKHKLQFHHLFPRKLLKEHGVAQREVNDIANLAFISGMTNRSIAAKRPADYIRKLVETGGVEPLRAQCVPTDPALLEPEDYDRFLTERRRLVCERLNEFLGTNGGAG